MRGFRYLINLFWYFSKSNNGNLWVNWETLLPVPSLGMLMDFLHTKMLFVFDNWLYWTNSFFFGWKSLRWSRAFWEFFVAGQLVYSDKWLAMDGFFLMRFLKKNWVLLWETITNSVTRILVKCQHTKT